MAHNYPDPTAGRDTGGGPFFSQNQAQRRSSNELELSQLTHEMTPSMNRQIISQMGPSVQDPRQIPNGYTDYVAAQYQTPPQQLTHPDPNMNASSAQDPAAQRKKAKVSRACDECRRKKIRCEFPTENPASHEKCSNCTRTTSACQFSRMPQKRGPSKGYIKELADKLASLENHVLGSPGQLNPAIESNHSSPQASNEFARTADMDYTRKRNHSASEDLSPQDYLQHGGPDRYPPQGGWAGQHGADQTPQYAAGYYPQGASQNGYSDLSQFAAGARGSITSNGADIANGHVPQAADDMNMEVNDSNWAWSEDMVNKYYQTVHMTLPLVAHAKKHLHFHLSSVSKPVRDAFLKAMETVVRQSSLNPESDAVFEDINQHILGFLTKTHTLDSSNNPFRDLVKLQTAVMMVLAIDVNGPIRKFGVQRAAFVGLANGIAQELNLHVNPVKDYNSAMTDSVDVVSRRAWWSLIVLDRWYAAGMAKHYQIVDAASKLTPEDPKVLGGPLYQLARLSLVLGHISMTFNTESSTPELVSTLVAGELDRFRESINDFILNMPILHVAYLHVQYLHQRHTLGSTLEVATIAANADVITSLLTNYRLPDFGPLKHHFAGLAQISLIECLDIDEFRDRSLKLQMDLQRPIEHKGLVSKGWASAILDYIGDKLYSKVSQSDNQLSGTDSGKGLQHLAEIAVGGKGAEKVNNTGEGSESANHQLGHRKDWTASTRSGYLNTLS